MIATCPHCGTTWEFEDDDIIIMLPYPHYECPNDGEWIPAF
jgi:hypothetical protein